MDINLKEITGNWEAGYALDKHTISSDFVGHNEFGHPQYDTKRTEVGEALFRLKYRSDQSQAKFLAVAIHEHI